MRDGAPRRMKVARDDVRVCGMAKPCPINRTTRFPFSILHAVVAANDR